MRKLDGVSNPHSNVSVSCLLHPPALRNKRCAADLWRADGLVVILTLPAGAPQKRPQKPSTLGSDLISLLFQNDWPES
jgi:hypothetical protein